MCVIHKWKLLVGKIYIWRIIHLWKMLKIWIVHQKYLYFTFWHNTRFKEVSFSEYLLFWSLIWIKRVDWPYLPSINYINVSPSAWVPEWLHGVDFNTDPYQTYKLSKKKMCVLSHWVLGIACYHLDSLIYKLPSSLTACERGTCIVANRDQIWDSGHQNFGAESATNSLWDSTKSFPP